MLSSIATLAARLLWPPRCTACTDFVAEGRAFCADCAASLDRLPWSCPGCAMPVAPWAVRDPCRACVARPLPFTQARAALGYGGALTQAILRLKHGRRRELAGPLGAVLASGLPDGVMDGIDAVLPVPLHPARLRRRGFNQALELARGAARVRVDFPAVWADTLHRLRDTRSLGHGTPEGRRRELQHVFAVPAPARVRGCRLLLIDDVMTTGATLGGCAEALLAAGAREVRTAVLARAV